MARVAKIRALLRSLRVVITFFLMQAPENCSARGKLSFTKKWEVYEKQVNDDPYKEMVDLQAGFRGMAFVLTIINPEKGTESVCRIFRRLVSGSDYFFYTYDRIRINRAIDMRECIQRG
jgi:hypothetical protein